jgi:hypothetical protein
MSIKSHTTLVKLAREIAIDHHLLETILENYNIDPSSWAAIQANHDFRRLLESEVSAWQSALNTHERTKLKAAALVEESLPECNTRLHDPKEPLNAKVEMLKALMRIAGMGESSKGQVEGMGERFSVTINLSGDSQLKFEKEVTPKVIEHAKT